MSNTLYISRRCKYCQELLIIIHKNKDHLKNLFSIIDIDRSPYPKYVTSVPHLIYNQTIILGDDIKNQLNMYVSELTQQEMPPLENSTIPKQSTNTDIYSNKHNTNQNNKSSVPVDTESSDDIDGYCIDGICGIQFSSIEENNPVTNSIYDSVDFESDRPEQSSMNVNKDNAPMDSSYEDFLQERNRDMPVNNQEGSKSIDFSLDNNMLDLRG